MNPETLALFALLDPSNTVAAPPNLPRIAMHLTGEETPSSLSCTTLPEMPTCSTSKPLVCDPLVELVEAATEHVMALAVLPGDEKADLIVDRLLAGRTQSKKKLKRT